MIKLILIDYIFIDKQALIEAIYNDNFEMEGQVIGGRSNNEALRYLKVR